MGRIPSEIRRNRGTVIRRTVVTAALVVPLALTPVLSATPGDRSDRGPGVERGPLKQTAAGRARHPAARGRALRPAGHAHRRRDGDDRPGAGTRCQRGDAGGDRRDERVHGRHRFGDDHPPRAPRQAGDAARRRPAGEAGGNLRGPDRRRPGHDRRPRGSRHDGGRSPAREDDRRPRAAEAGHLPPARRRRGPRDATSVSIDVRSANRHMRRALDGASPFTAKIGEATRIKLAGRARPDGRRAAGTFGDLVVGDRVIVKLRAPRGLDADALPAARRIIDIGPAPVPGAD